MSGGPFEFGEFEGEGLEKERRRKSRSPFRRCLPPFHRRRLLGLANLSFSLIDPPLVLVSSLVSLYR